MSTTPEHDPRRPALLRRVDRYALLGSLSQRQRQARLVWGKKRYSGHIRAWPRNNSVSFRVDGGAAASLGLPQADTAVDLHFTIRGLSFRCEGLVREVQREQGRLLLAPELIEWAARRVDLPGDRKLRDQVLLYLVDPSGKSTELAVTGMAEEHLDFVSWPCPSRFAEQIEVQGRLLLPGRTRLDLPLRLERSAPVFPGAQGRVVRARILGETSLYREALAGLVNDAAPAPA